MVLQGRIRKIVQRGFNEMGATVQINSATQTVVLTYKNKDNADVTEVYDFKGRNVCEVPKKGGLLSWLFAGKKEVK